MKTVQVSRRSASYRRVLAATAVLAVSRGIRGVHAAAWAGTCPTGSTDPGGATGFHQCQLDDGYYLKGAGTDATGATDVGIDVQPAPAGYWSAHASTIVLTTSTGTDVWDGTTDGALGAGNAAATSGVTKCPSDSGSTSTANTAISACKCDAGYKATASNTCTACTTAGTDWITAPSVGTTATFCEAIKAGYYGTLGSGADASPTACPSGWTSAGITSGGPTTIADCFQAASGITPDKTMYGKSGDSTNVYYCPTGTVSTVNAAAGTASFCSSIRAGYWGTAGNTASAHASSLTACTANSDSAQSATTTTIGACKCDAGYKATNSNTCTACPTGTDWTTAPSVGTTATFCEGVKTGFAGSAGSGADATITGCASGYYIATPATNAASSNTDATGLVCTQVPANKYFTTTTTTPLEVTTAEAPTACPSNSNSDAGSTVLADCKCAANFYPSSNTCAACASGTTRAGTVSVTGTATCSAAATPTADSAGASTPIAVALATAAAVPLLL